MANNKIKLANGLVLIDLTADTVDAAHLAKGYMCHDKSGAIITGTANLAPDVQYACIQVEFPVGSYVRMVQGFNSVNSDTSGSYIFRIDAAGTYNLTLYTSGISQKTAQVIIDHSGQTEKIDFTNRKYLYKKGSPCIPNTEGWFGMTPAGGYQSIVEDIDFFRLSKISVSTGTIADGNYDTNTAVSTIGFSKICWNYKDINAGTTDFRIDLYSAGATYWTQGQYLTASGNHYMTLPRQDPCWVSFSINSNVYAPGKYVEISDVWLEP